MTAHATWPASQIRYVARLGTGHTPSRSEDAYWQDCTIPWLTLADVHRLRDGSERVIYHTKEKISPLGLANSSAVIHSAGTVAMSRTASVGFTCILGTDMATSQDFVTWTCGPGMLPEFLLWALRGTRDEILSNRQGSTHQTIYMSDVERLRTPVPPLPMQRLVADFLDRETARIDELVAKKRRMIQLLEEWFGSWLRHEIRALGIDEAPLKRRWKVIDCKHRTPEYVDDGYPVISPGDISPGRVDPGRATRFVDGSDFDDLTGGGRRPRRGDIIYSRNASIGIAAYVDTDEPFCMGQDVCLITSSDQSQLYLTYVLNSVGMDQLESEKLGSTFSRINVSQILELLIPLPVPEIQQHLATRFDAERQRTRRIQDTMRQQLEVLAEYRRALVAAAVTGQLDEATLRGEKPVSEALREEVSA